MVVTCTYNSLNRLTDEVVKDANGNTLASYVYTLGNAGNRTGVAETQLLPNGTMDTRTVVYQYDNLYRLLSETISGDSQGGNGTISYTYDLVGNRMSRSSNVAGVASSTSTYNANDELTSEVDNGVTTNYSYDANGDTISSSLTGQPAGSADTLIYDSQNRLVKQDAGQAGEVDITYNGAGNKVAETVGGVTTKYIIDGNNPTGYSQIVEEIVNGAVTRRYTLGHWIISETQNISGTWTTSFYGYDGHNSVRFLTNAAGAVTDNYTFDAFGIKIAGSGTTPNQILYSGEFLDPGTGNYDLRAREYNQNIGAFTTMDTTPGQLPYVYTSDNPVMFIDPSGKFGITETLGTISLMSLMGGLVSGAIASDTVGGNFYDGFAKGFISTFITTTLIMVDVPPQISAVAGSAIATGLVDWYEGKYGNDTWAAVEDIGTSMILSFAAGSVGSRYLQGLSADLPAIAASIKEIPEMAALAEILTQVGKASFRGGLLGSAIGLVTTVDRGLAAMIVDLERLAQERNHAIDNLLG
jgi:RHS repeat-associated protein